MFLSGGAPLDLETETFFDDAGLRVLQGYGMTETSPVISMNTQTAYQPGSVGRPIPGVEVLLPGEPQARTKLKRLEDGVPVSPAVWDELSGLRKQLDVEAWLE